MALWFFASVFPARRSLFPHLVGELLDHAKLRPLLLLGEDVALLGGGEAALRREAELLQRSELGGLVDPPLDVVLLLERAALGGDEPEHHGLVAFRQEAQRLQTPRAGAVGFAKGARRSHPSPQPP